VRRDGFQSLGQFGDQRLLSGDDGRPAGPKEARLQGFKGNAEVGFKVCEEMGAVLGAAGEEDTVDVHQNRFLHFCSPASAIGSAAPSSRPLGHLLPEGRRMDKADKQQNRENKKGAAVAAPDLS
jgi:hypothetical protein